MNLVGNTFWWFAKTGKGLCHPLVGARRSFGHVVRAYTYTRLLLCTLLLQLLASELPL